MADLIEDSKVENKEKKSSSKQDSIESKVDSKVAKVTESRQDSIESKAKVTESKVDSKVTESKQSKVDSKNQNLESFINSLSPQEAKLIRNFIDSSVYDTFMTYLEGIFREKDTIIHRINCYCFRAKDNVNIRILGKIYEIKKGEVIYIQKDAYGNSLLRNNKLERIM